MKTGQYLNKIHKQHTHIYHDIFICHYQPIPTYIVVLVYV